MEIIDGKCYMTIGDKVKSLLSNEGGEIIEIVNQEHAKIEFFDEELIMSHKNLSPLKTSSSEKYHIISFYRAAKKKKRIKETFSNEILDRIDLHAKSLFDDYRTMSAENIAVKQILSLDHYLQRAVDSKHYILTIVHGKGTGSLRSQVIDLLEKKYHLFNLDLSDQGKTIVYL